MKLPVQTTRAVLLASASLSLLAAAPALAQAADASAPMALAQANTASGQISGIVKNANGNLLPGATVRLEGSNIVETTGPDGRFLIRNAPAGQAQIRVRYFGIDAVEQTVTVIAGEAVDVTVLMGAAQSDEAGTITVTASKPIAESEAAALQQQRSSTSLVSIIAADSIGRFPDQNIAASLARLPGIAVQRDQGQDRFVSLRGARTSWTTVSFDGINVISPAGRETRFDTIPATIASRVAVRKAVTADLTGEAVAGQIDIRTRSAFDYPGFKVAVDLGMGFSALGGGRQYNFAGHISDRFFNDTIGILLSASRFEVDMITDNFEADPWELAPEDQLPGNTERVWAREFENKLYRLTRSNTAFSGKIDWRPDNNNEIFLSVVHTEFRDDELRSNYIFDFDQNAVNTSDTRPQSAARRTGYADIRTGNTPLQGTLYGIEIDSTLNSLSTRQRIFTNTLGGNHTFGEWKASWRLNFTRAQDDSRNPFTSTWVSPSDRTRRPSIVYDFTNPSDNRVTLYNTVADANQNYSLGARRDIISTTELDFVNFNRLTRRDQTDAYTARLDIDRNITLFGQDTKIQFGGQYNQRTKDSNRTNIEVIPSLLTARGIALPRQDDISTNEPLKVGIPLGYSFRYHDTKLGTALLDSYIAAGASRIQANTTENNFYEVTEEIFAGYLMGTMFFDNGNIVAGVRAERVNNTGQANGFINGVRTPLNTSSGNTLFFPSLHINYDATDEIKLRLSLNTGAARPDYDLLRPNLTIDDNLQTISGGNPFAVPEKAVGVDAYLEWYMANRGFLSVGVYYKKVRDVLFGFTQPFGNTEFDEGGLERSTYLISTDVNGGSGEIKGIELAYSQPLESLMTSIGAPEWMNGFGFQGNITINRSSAFTPDGRKVKLPDASDLNYNASLYYEQYGLSLRASWQYRSDYLFEIGNAAIGGDGFWQSVGRLDVSARYAISPRVELFVDATNLLDEPGRRYRGEKIRVLEYEKFGARFMGGVRINLGGSRQR